MALSSIKHLCTLSFLPGNLRSHLLQIQSLQARFIEFTGIIVAFPQLRQIVHIVPPKNSGLCGILAPCLESFYTRSTYPFTMPDVPTLLENITDERYSLLARTPVLELPLPLRPIEQLFDSYNSIEHLT